MVDISPILPSANTQRNVFIAFSPRLDKKIYSEDNMKTNMSSATTRVQMTKTSFPHFKVDSRNDLSFSAETKKEFISNNSYSRFSALKLDKTKTF